VVGQRNAAGIVGNGHPKQAHAQNQQERRQAVPGPGRRDLDSVRTIEGEPAVRKGIKVSERSFCLAHGANCPHEPLGVGEVRSGSAEETCIFRSFVGRMGRSALRRPEYSHSHFAFLMLSLSSPANHFSLVVWLPQDEVGQVAQHGEQAEGAEEPARTVHHHCRAQSREEDQAGHAPVVVPGRCIIARRGWTIDSAFGTPSSTSKELLTSRFRSTSALNLPTNDISTSICSSYRVV
jgi:hypothetical protein